MKKSVYSKEQKILQAMLKDARKQTGLTQQHLAAILEKPQSFVAKYESGERLLNVIELITILRCLNSEPSEFFKKFVTAIQ